MLVYGDFDRVESADAVRSSVLAALDRAGAMEPGLERHAELVGAFIRANELVQGIADAEFDEKGCDAGSETQDTGARLLVAMAQAIDRSWKSRFEAEPPISPGVGTLLGALDHSGPIRTRPSEGYEFYALYPESYLAAARNSGLGQGTRVIGIRSIGLGLAALVAAALGAQPPVSLRPTGHPFDRRVRVAPELTTGIIADPGADFAIVDEGPGQSGSSFAAVAAWLQENGVAPEQIHFFPSHPGGPGGQASPAIRQCWERSARHPGGFMSTLIEAAEPAHRLGSWIADAVGPLDAPIEDVSSGKWRRLRYASQGDWPPADTRFERRKFLARSRGEAWLAKFGGLGEAGARKFAAAHRLQEAGFTPEIGGLSHGFILQRWVEGRALDPNFSRGRLIETLGGYLGWRARNLEPVNRGAPFEELARMARFNAEQALGVEVAAALESFLGRYERIGAALRPVNSDNRLHVWEWLVAPDGRLLKTDALDHSSGHDLIGCQDVAWDIAGAAVEHELSRAEAARLREIVAEESGRPVEDDIVAVLTPCYLAFQLGLWTTAASSHTGDEAQRLRRHSGHYASRLAEWVEVWA